ncbi:hypothetical protein SDC9_27518 [bioreactor metagenome]|uniref:Uncharacterized protein n=1 Tax=bioreactor metagenome TaxID=1076179 RepID=A0A644URB6_9ZZZZ|nr:hypothetical protein [Negativicutes bacterium]
MGYYSKKLIDDTTMEFPRWGFWFVHVVGTILIFGLGMRFAIHRAPIPLLGYRLIRKLTRQ